MSSGFNLAPREHANFAVSSRLLSCLVTESLLRAFYLEAKHSRGMTGILVILSTSVMSEQPVITRTLRPNDIFAIVPLRNPPVFTDARPTKHGRVVGLVDPLDMIPEIYILAETISGAPDGINETILSCLRPPPWELGKFNSLAKCTDPTDLWNKFVKDVFIPDSLSESIAGELRSSWAWQLASYENPPACPSRGSPPIEWEQSLMHRARMCADAPSNYNWYLPQIRFVRVPSESLDIRGPFDSIMRDFVNKASLASGTEIPVDVPGTTFMPVHEMQLPTVVAKFKNVQVLEPSIGVLGQSSIRTMLVPALPNMALKVSVNMKISSALRTISHWTADFGPRFSRDIVPKLTVNHKIFDVELEPASAIYAGVDSSVRKHFTAIFRHEYIPAPGENIIVVAALLEMGHAGVPAGVSAVEHIFGLDTEEKRIAFLDKYLRLACEALIPPALHNGVVFEAHAQNCLLRFDIATGEPLGFVRIIRLLGMHCNGRGWEMLRGHLRDIIPQDHGLWKSWMETDTVPGKCLMRMRLQSVHDKMVFSPVPNMLLYRPEAAAVEA
ncbi:C2 domain-containing protein [Mycena sanguinolenta]|uniref:C2 domain-containing protein n=1 Tax=Mycena sanguinolenta TaxID=230812 RepID=A0A8H7DI57_9AGAR|nr:C2 domain-containing protein [Mycena sanguinolenta]